MKRYIIAALVMFSALNVTFACETQYDCSEGSACAFIDDNNPTEGICIGGNYPSNDYDSRPPQLSGTQGRPCVYSSDCGLGEACEIDLGSDIGVCL